MSPSWWMPPVSFSFSRRLPSRTRSIVSRPMMTSRRSGMVVTSRQLGQGTAREESFGSTSLGSQEALCVLLLAEDHAGSGPIPRRLLHTALQAFLDLPSKFPLWLQVLSAMAGAHLEVHLDAICRHPPGNPYTYIVDNAQGRDYIGIPLRKQFEKAKPWILVEKFALCWSQPWTIKHKFVKIEGLRTHLVFAHIFWYLLHVHTYTSAPHTQPPVFLNIHTGFLMNWVRNQFSCWLQFLTSCNKTLSCNPILRLRRPFGAWPILNRLCWNVGWVSSKPRYS